MNTRFDMMLPRRQTILGGVALAAGAAAPARAQLTIDMTRPSFEPVPIAIVDFKGDRGADIAGVVRNDLQNSGLFRSIAPSAFIQQNMDPNAPPRFPDWRSIGAAGVVVGQITSSGGNIKVDFRLWDVVVGQQAKNMPDESLDGGIGYGPAGTDSGKPDLSNTVMAIEALHATKNIMPTELPSNLKDLNWQAAVEFVQRCQNLRSARQDRPRHAGKPRHMQPPAPLGRAGAGVFAHVQAHQVVFAVK